MPEAILIVDGTATNRKLAQRVLTGAGYDVRSVADAAAALRTIPEFQPKLVLTDLRLEGMDGLTLTRRIKEDPLTRQTLVIAVTGCGTEDDRSAALNAGCDDFIVKPIDTRTLPVVVQAHLARQEQDAISLEDVAHCSSAELPSWALELCHDFIHEGAAKAARLLEEEATPEEIRRGAHVWAGLGGTFGFPEITRLARQLEELLRTPAPASDQVSGLLRRLTASFSQAAASSAGTLSCLDLPAALVESLSGKKFALLGFDGHDSARLSEALESAGGQVLVPPSDTDGSDLMIAAAGSDETNAFLRETRDAPAQPLLLVGTRRTGPQVEMMLDSAVFDFAAAPWTAEEILARAHRLLTRPQHHAPSPQPYHRDRKLRVFIADDDATVLTLLKTTVESYGMDCSVASEGDKALAMMRAAPPDAAILDVIMPNMDGLEVLAAIRNDPVLKHIRVLLLSALQQESDIVRALGLGADDYVTKPFSPVEVVARLKRLVRSEA
jgi:two-component system, cell cycle response regulator DivK